MWREQEMNMRMIELTNANTTEENMLHADNHSGISSGSIKCRSMFLRK